MTTAEFVNGLPLLEVGGQQTLLLVGSIAKYGVVNRHTSEVVVNGIFGLDEGIRDVWHIESTVAFTGQIDLGSLHFERIDKALVEAKKLLCKLDLIGDVWRALREANSDGLLHPHHIG